MAILRWDAASGAYVDVENVKKYDTETGAWVDCQSGMAQKEGVWEEVWPVNKRIYLFNNGDHCTGVTGGWKLRNVGSKVAASITDMINIRMLDYAIAQMNEHSVYVSTGQEVSLAGFSEICAHIINYSGATSGSPRAELFVGEKRQSLIKIGTEPEYDLILDVTDVDSGIVTLYGYYASFSVSYIEAYN